MQKKRRKRSCGFLAFFLLLFFGGGIALYVYGQSITTTTATNIVTVGKVDVELAMATHDAGTIVPGETKISNTVTVENVGVYPAYIRMFVKKHWVITQGGVTLTPEQISNQYSELSVDAIDIQLENGWTKGESSSSYPGYDCYYYKEVVDTDKKGVDAIAFSDSYQLKAEEKQDDGGISNELLLKFTKNGAKVDGYYSVIVEAIQADTCIPVTKEIDGETMITDWNDIPSDVELVPPFDMDPADAPVGIVNFKSENTEITDSDAFITVDSLLPGETAQRMVEIRNTSDQMLPIYVYAESAESYENLSDDQKNWLEQLLLVIVKEDGTVLYKDSLYKPNSDEPMLSMYNPILIDKFPANTTQNLYVIISCPATWTKASVTVKVNWIFASKKAVATKAPSSADQPAVLKTDVPDVTEGPLLETDIPQQTEEPFPTATDHEMPMITELPGEVTYAPEATISLVTAVPSPQETGVIVTDSPVWEGKETVRPSMHPMVQETPDMVDGNEGTPKPSSDIGIGASKDPDTPAPAQTPEKEDVSNQVPKTSTPKKPTTVEVLYPTKTGDATPIVVWLVLFVVSCIGMISVATAWKKKR